MPLHLRSGILKNPPVKKYKFAKDIFAEEKAKNYTKNTPAEVTIYLYILLGKGIDSKRMGKSR